MKVKLIVLAVLAAALIFVTGMWFYLPITETMTQNTLVSLAPDAPSIPQEVSYSVTLESGDILYFYRISPTQLLCDSGRVLTLYDETLGAVFGYEGGKLLFASPMY